MLFSVKNTKGFSIIELVVALAILGLLAGATVSAFNGFRDSDKIFSAREEVLSVLRRASQASRVSAEDDGWSVRMENGELTIYKGSDWTGRDVGFDETFSLPRGVVLSGLNNVSFARVSAETDDTGQIILNYADRQKNIEISEIGVISD